jgi:hypothetical protein
MSTRTLRIVVIGLCGVGVAIALAGCGDKSSDASGTTTTTASDAEQFASGTCNAISAWRADVTKAVNTLRATPTRDNAKQAVTDTKAATSTFASAIGDLGRPGTASGKQAQATLQTLEQQLRDGGAKIGNAVDNLSGLSGSAAAISTISSTLVTMRDQVTAAGKALRELPTGELQEAFRGPDCDSLREGAA